MDEIVSKVTEAVKGIGEIYTHTLTSVSASQLLFSLICVCQFPPFGILSDFMFLL